MLELLPIILAAVGLMACANVHANNIQVLSHTRATNHCTQADHPGMSGGDGRDIREKALQLAQLVIGKIRKGEMPPNVTPEELKERNIH